MTETTLTLLLAGPLQSWGEASRHMTRSTLAHPSKSGVLGLLAAALGRGRGEDLSDLAALRLAVRIDQPGQLLTDYHTVTGASQAPLLPGSQRLPTADGGSLRLGESTKVTRRYYLADARFVAAVEGDDKLLSQAWDALAHPRYPLYLGRRSCPPSRPVRLRLWPATPLTDALTRTPWMAAEHITQRHRDSEVRLPVVVEDEAGGETFNDQPLTSPPFRRHYASRLARHTTVCVPAPSGTQDDRSEHGPRDYGSDDPFDLLPGEQPCT
jgi:CRISPR system Cascade subunit CasD